MINILVVFEISSTWQFRVLQIASKVEKLRGTDILMPIRIDDAVMETDKAWAAKLRRQRNIGDFKNWKDHDQYKKGFEELLKWLRYKKEE